MIPFYEEQNKQFLDNEAIEQESSVEARAIAYQEEAELYWRASNYLRESNPYNNDITKKDYLIPSIVLLSYSCEIGLKSILTLKNIEFNRKHSISYLYNLLEISSKQEILKEFKKSFKFFLIKAYSSSVNRIIEEVGNLTIEIFNQKIDQYFKLDYFISLRYRTLISNDIYYPFALNALASATKNHSATLLGLPEPSIEEVRQAWGI